jgi:hypothetical protein
MSWRRYECELPRHSLGGVRVTYCASECMSAPHLPNVGVIASVPMISTIGPSYLNIEYDDRGFIDESLHFAILVTESLPPLTSTELNGALELLEV